MVRKFIMFAIGIARNDEDARFELLQRVGRLVMPRYRFSWPQMDWWRHEQFNALLSRFGELTGANTQRHWMVRSLARLASSVPGDTAECGVFRGCASAVICTSMKRRHYLFDSFQGLSAPSDIDGTHWQAGALSASEADVVKNLDGFDVTVMRGWIPERFAEVEERRFAFVHIDVDLYQPTRDSIEFFYPRLNPGAILLCDDYGFTTCPGATAAIDEYLRDKPEQMIPLADGGGFIVKGVTT